jgi:hypothetical protein
MAPSVGVLAPQLALASAAAMIAVRPGQNSIASSQEGQPAGAEPDSINR